MGDDVDDDDADVIVHGIVDHVAVDVDDDADDNVVVKNEIEVDVDVDDVADIDDVDASTDVGNATLIALGISTMRPKVWVCVCVSVCSRVCVRV